MIKSLLTFVAFLTLFSLSAQTFSSTVNEAIPDDGSTVYYDIEVSGLPLVADTSFGLERVCLNLKHTYTEDMNVQLKAPDGTTVLLFGGVGGGSDDFLGTCVQGSGPGIGGFSGPFTGTYRSMGDMGKFNRGQDPNGTWTLIIHDTYAFADEGFLIDWAMTFGDEPARAFVFAGSNLPIVKLTTIGDPIVDDPKVPVLMQILDHGPVVRNNPSQTDYAYEGTIMAEWQGYTGPYYPKKNYDFELVDQNGNKLDSTILGMPKESDWIFKAEYLDHTLLKNSITYEMARRMGGYAPRTRPCELILDGEYIGMYVLTEKVKRDNDRVDIAKLASKDTVGSALTGGYIIEMNINNKPGDWNSPYPPINSATNNLPVEFKHVYPKRDEIQPQQRDYIRAYVDSFENSLLAANFDDRIEGYRKFIDVETFIDFLIVNEFSVNYDSYGRSTYMYKEKDKDGGKLKSGPPWDYDRAMEYNNFDSSKGWVWEITHPVWPFPFWWSRMWQDESYRKQLACRWTMLRQSTLSTDAFMGLIDTLKTEIYEAQERNFTIWSDLGASTYDDQINALKNYVGARLVWIDEELAVEEVAAPEFYFPADTVLCAGTIFDAALLGGPQYDYNWQPGPDTSTYSFPASGVYHVKVTDQYGCYVKKDIDVTIAPVGDASFTAQQIDSSAVWSFQPNDPDAAIYQWNFGDGSFSSEAAPLHQYATLGTYIVSLTTVDSFGCAAKTVQDTVQFLTSGIVEQANFKGIVYPNPFREKIQIEFTQAVEENVTVSLENEWGQQLLSQQYGAGTTRCSLATEKMPAGVFLVKITQKGKQVVTLKLVHL